MTTAAPQREAERSPQDHLRAVQELLARRRAVQAAAQMEGAASPPAQPGLLQELQRRIEALHPADVAFVLENLPRDERRLVWDLVRDDRGDVLLEVSDAVRDTLLADMGSDEIVAATQDLEADEIADLAPDLPEDVVQDIIEAQDVEDRAELQAALSYPEGTVGALMDFDVVSIRDDVSCEVALRYLRRFDELPRQTDALFVVDRDKRLKGALALNRLLVTDPDVEVVRVYEPQVVSFRPDDDADEAADAFNRYDLVSAPVVDAQGRLVARLPVETVLDYVRERQEQQALAQAGLREEEDMFASVWASARNRGPWLALNLCTAFISSRVVGLFEGSIAQLAALAALMPIVAGIGGNAGNQTSTLIVRAIALGEVSNARRLLLKELGTSALNGALWGSVLGLAAWALYRNVALGGVMALAMLLNLLVAALAGYFIPFAMERFGRDPAVGTSVFLTFVTDSMGFFIFLGLATVFLV
ncbi:MAG TPA: magnesium transporter [Usitatibacter sp.]|jgi:magnesium transporter|nr:magnesium transporter [Usitatibacter sp.]